MRSNGAIRGGPRRWRNDRRVDEPVPRPKVGRHPRLVSEHAFDKLRLLDCTFAAFDAGLSTDDPASLMDRFLQAMGRSPHPLYLFIDEYDNFTNDLIARGDHPMYRDVVHASGFVREFYKTVKEGAARGVIPRIFMTGVSPVTLDDLTSGFNVTSNISLDEDFNALAGFTTE